MRAVVFQHTCVSGCSRGSIEPRTMEQSQVALVELEWGWQSPKASSKPTVAASGSRMEQRAVARASRLLCLWATKTQCPMTRRQGEIWLLPGLRECANDL